MSAPAQMFIWLGALWDVSVAAFRAQPLLITLWLAWIAFASIAVGQGLDRNGWRATMFAVLAVSCFAIACALPRPSVVLVMGALP